VAAEPAFACPPWRELVEYVSRRFFQSRLETGDRDLPKNLVAAIVLGQPQNPLWAISVSRVRHIQIFADFPC
jgi:hypothetical protein